MRLIILLFIYLFYLFKGQTAHLLEEQGKLKVKYEKQLYLFFFFSSLFSVSVTFLADASSETFRRAQCTKLFNFVKNKCIANDSATWYCAFKTTVPNQEIKVSPSNVCY